MTWRLNWCASCGGGHNFGDQLGPILLRHYGIPFTFAKPGDANLVTVGSILSKVPGGWRGTVLGTGLIQPYMHKDLTRARVLSVRGILTRRACNLSTSTPLGDLGILVGELPRATVPAMPALVVPHYVDHVLATRHPGVLALRITSEPAALLGAIAASEVVYTSSLHALIAADALGVPAVLEPHEAVHGGMHKFRDYASAFGSGIVAGVPYLSPRKVMEQRQAEARGLIACLR